MKRTTIEAFSKNPQGYIEAAQRERLLVTRRGKPLVLVMGMRNKDAEDLDYESSPEFWAMIREARRMPTIPLAEVEEELLGKQKASRPGTVRRDGAKGQLRPK